MNGPATYSSQAETQALRGTREFEDMRHELERLKIQSLTTGDHFALICLSCKPSMDRSMKQIVDQIKRFKESVADGWAHETIVGWLSTQSLAVILPNATPVDAWEYCEKLRSICKTDEINVYAKDATRITLAGSEIPISSIDNFLLRPSSVWKRSFDLIFGGCMLMMALPFILLAALLVRLTTSGPAFFSQKRVGFGGKPFSIYKLRTMREDADERKDEFRQLNEVDGLGFKIEEDPRVTEVGRFLRKTSIDELPQLLNVIRGEMSLVGPRPLPCNDWHPHELWMNARHDVKPGLTCIWQIKGRGRRSSVSFEEWMKMDIEYIESADWQTDLKLIAQTIPAVLSQRGAT